MADKVKTNTDGNVKTDDSGNVKTRKSPAPRVTPELTEINSTLQMPEPPRNSAGAKTPYPFDKLEVGTSFGVKNKTLAQLASIISNQNRKHRIEKRDDAGGIVYKTTTAKGADGTEQTVPTSEPEMEETKRFFGVEVDPKKDPDGAQVRVWRQK